jgi:hypothetical protein
MNYRQNGQYNGDTGSGYNRGQQEQQPSHDPPTNAYQYQYNQYGPPQQQMPTYGQYGQYSQYGPPQVPQGYGVPQHPQTPTYSQYYSPQPQPQPQPNTLAARLVQQSAQQQTPNQQSLYGTQQTGHDVRAGMASTVAQNVGLPGYRTVGQNHRDGHIMNGFDTSAHVSDDMTDEWGSNRAGSASYSPMAPRAGVGAPSQHQQYQQQRPSTSVSPYEQARSTISPHLPSRSPQILPPSSLPNQYPPATANNQHMNNIARHVSNQAVASPSPRPTSSGHPPTPARLPSVPLPAEAQPSQPIQNHIQQHHNNIQIPPRPTSATQSYHSPRLPANTSSPSKIPPAPSASPTFSNHDRQQHSGSKASRAMIKDASSNTNPPAPLPQPQRPSNTNKSSPAVQVRIATAPKVPSPEPPQHVVTTIDPQKLFNPPPKLPSISDAITYDMLLLSLSEEYVDAAYQLGPRVALLAEKHDVETYNGLMAAGLRCLDAVLKVS